MRVSRIQAEANRQTVIDTACRLFREHGYDGIGLKDLMQAAGLTQGAFYKQFESKDDLIVQASNRALEGASQRWATASEARPQDPMGAVLDFYLSARHRNQRMEGCPIVALSADAARKGPEVRAPFETGIRDHLAKIADWTDDTEGEEPGDGALVILSTMIGAMVLSRAVNDETLAGRLLNAAHEAILTGRNEHKVAAPEGAQQ